MDTPFGPSRGDVDPRMLTEVYDKAKARRTLDALDRQEPGWLQQDRDVEALAAEQFDVATSVSLFASVAGLDFAPLSLGSAVVPPRQQEEGHVGGVVGGQWQRLRVELLQQYGARVAAGAPRLLPVQDEHLAQCGEFGGHPEGERGVVEAAEDPGHHIAGRPRQLAQVPYLLGPVRGQ